VLLKCSVLDSQVLLKVLVVGSEVLGSRGLQRWV